MASNFFLIDSSLGGIQREYREVKREARVGERIKIVDAGTTFGHYKNGDVISVTDTWNGEAHFPIKNGADEMFAYEREYVVLEPTDIVRIDNERLRMVDRKAAVGERVIVAEQVKDDRFSIGETYEVVYVYGGSTWVEHPQGTHIESGGAYLTKYRVLEPVESAKPLSEQAAATISALTAKVQSLESRVAALEMASEAVKVAEGLADDMPPSFAGRPRAKSLQQIREEIVERAKADVKELLSQNYPDLLSWGVWFAETRSISVTDECEFIVDRDKRTVVALIRDIDSANKPVILRGIAKCAPNDVFNAHLGKALALRRALGLEVPADYLNVPNPEEPRVGDVVIGVDDDRDNGVVGRVTAVRPSGYFAADKGLIVDKFSGTGWNYIDAVKIIDDSRESVEEVCA